MFDVKAVMKNKLPHLDAVMMSNLVKENLIHMRAVLFTDCVG